MAYPPTLTDYASLIINLLGLFNQDHHNQSDKQGRPLTYTEESFTIFFIIMQYRGIHGFKSQRRWLSIRRWFGCWAGLVCLTEPPFRDDTSLYTL